MGRHDAYSYHSEAGRASGIPGEDNRLIKDDDQKSTCPVCKKRKEDVVERSGSWSGEKMCSDCLDKKQEQKEQEEAKSIIDKIRENKR